MAAACFLCFVDYWLQPDIASLQTPKPGIAVSAAARRSR